jgi:hypothetical protein
MLGLAALSTKITYIHGLNAPIRVFATARLEVASVSLVMTVLLANVLSAQITVMIVVPAGQKSIWQARLVVYTSLHGTP